MIGTPWDNAAAAPVTSVNAQTGDVVLTASDLGAEPEGAAEAAVTAHNAAVDPHPQYQLRGEAGQPEGYAQLDASGLVLQDPANASETPTPGVLARADGSGLLDAWISAASTSTPGLVQFASNAEVASNKAVQANDSRLSNARPPSSHATSHQHGGSDEIASATAGASFIPKANTAGKLNSSWGGGADSLATLDSSTLIPTAQHGTGTADSTSFLRGDRVWSPAVVGNLGATDNALLRADGTGGLTAQGSAASVDDAGNLKTGNRSLNQPIAPSPWAGVTSSHDLPLPSWATTAGKYYALARMRVQQNATTTSFQGRTHQFDLTYNGSSWTIDGTASFAGLGPLSVTVGWSISGATNLRLTISGMGAGNSGNVGLVFEQFVYLGAL